jgi:UTP--glucose-1-phosphate uridylyltransferase
MSRSIGKVVIPAAGLGTRLLPATKSQPKEMLPVGRKPILQHVVEELLGARLDQILIITGRRKRAIEDHFDADPYLETALEGGEADAAPAWLEGEARFFYTRQSAPRGLGHAVSLAAEFVDRDDCVVALGDSLIWAEDPAAPLRAMMEVHEQLGAAAVVAVERVEPALVDRYGIVSIDGAEPPPGEPVAMTGVVEKPSAGSAPSNLAVAARYVFSPAIFEALARTPPDERGEVQLTDAIKRLIDNGLPVYAWPLGPGQRRYDVGNFASYFRAFVDYALEDGEHGRALREYLKTRMSGS